RSTSPATATWKCAPPLRIDLLRDSPAVIKIKHFTAHCGMLVHLFFTESSRVFQPIEHQKDAVRHSVEGDTVTRKWRGGLEILEKHSALVGVSRDNQSRPCRA